MTVLALQRVDARIGGALALQGVSLELGTGSATALLGRNGAGKTSTLRSILGFTDVVAGDIVFQGRSLLGLAPWERAQLGIGYVPEHRGVFAQLTVEENLRLAERRRGQYDRRRNELLELFPDLARLRRLSGSQLSGGQQQMLALARALVPDNTLLLIDEPFEGLAPVLVEQLAAAFPAITERATVLMVEQRLDIVSELADRYSVLVEGRSVRSGDMPELAAAPESIDEYLGAA